MWTHNGTRNTRRDPAELAAELESLGAGEITVNAPVTSVATTTLPSPSIPSESNSCIPGNPHKSAPTAPPAFVSTSPGPVTFHAYTRPVWVSAAYTREPSGDRPMPLGESLGKITSRIELPSGCA